MINEVTIEPVSLHYASVLERLVSDPEVAETTKNIPNPYPEGGAAAWIRESQEHSQAGTAYGFSILADGEFLGSVSILNVRQGYGEIAYWIGRPYWGNGYATAAGLQVLAVGFAEVGLTSFVGKCLARNTGSYRVLEKLGFQLTGFKQIELAKWPTPERVAEFILYRDDWEKACISNGEL